MLLFVENLMGILMSPIFVKLVEDYLVHGVEKQPLKNF
jgi:hypothetical protein